MVKEKKAKEKTKKKSKNTNPDLAPMDDFDDDFSPIEDNNANVVPESAVGDDYRRHDDGPNGDVDDAIVENQLYESSEVPEASPPEPAAGKKGKLTKEEKAAEALRKKQEKEQKEREKRDQKQREKEAKRLAKEEKDRLKREQKAEKGKKKDMDKVPPAEVAQDLETGIEVTDGHMARPNAADIDDHELTDDMGIERPSVTTPTDDHPTTPVVLRDGKKKSKEQKPKEQKTKVTVKPAGNALRVWLLDETEYMLNIDSKMTGMDALDGVCKCLDLLEKDYFGLSIRDNDGLRFWIHPDKKVMKQLKSHEDNWRDGTVYFEVKFYPLDPHHLHEDLTRYQLCLQVRRDIVSGRLPCSFVTLSLLGSYTAQAELGDYDPEEHGPVGSVQYLEQLLLAPPRSLSPELLEKICELHKQHKGLTPEQAEVQFLENAKKLSMYGVDLHWCRDYEDVPIALGISANGINVYRERLRINRFAWPKIVKISYRKAYFFLRIRPAEFEEFESNIGFRVQNSRLAKRLWRTAVEHHTFFRLKEPEAAKPAGPGLLGGFFGSSRFRFSMRTHHQLRSSAFDRSQRPGGTSPAFQRMSTRRATGGLSRSVAGGLHDPALYGEGGAFANSMGGYDTLPGRVGSGRPQSMSLSAADDGRPTEEPRRFLASQMAPGSAGYPPGAKTKPTESPYGGPINGLDERPREPQRITASQMQVPGRGGGPGGQFVLEQVQPAHVDLESSEPSRSEKKRSSGRKKDGSTSSSSKKKHRSEHSRSRSRSPKNFDEEAAVTGEPTRHMAGPSSSSVTTKKTTTTYRTERGGHVETVREDQIIVEPHRDDEHSSKRRHKKSSSSGARRAHLAANGADETADEDREMLAAAIENVTAMNPKLTVERVEIKTSAGRPSQHSRSRPAPAPAPVTADYDPMDDLEAEL